jgi:histidinol-phosphatase (PHP family)
MLTDYHVHLRPDDPGTFAAAYFVPGNAERYRETATERGVAELGVSEHVHRFTAALDVWQHPFWRQSAVDDLDRYVGFVREETDLRLGIEADYIRGTEDRMGSLLEAHEWDYVLGSVHFLGEFAVDFDDETDIWRHENSAERIWKRYFEAVAESALTGLFDVITHPDLVKIWGSARPQPSKDPRFYYEPAIEAMLEAGVAMEVSTAGLRKPVGEIYPSRAMLEMALDAGIPIALSSDAHRPEHLAYGYEEAVKLLSECGVKELAVLGGVEIPHERGLDGHSDADVLAHAITDAILGAASLGDIGTHFPDTDEQWRGADSVELLREIVRRVAAEGWRVEHVDATVMLERPKLAPFREAIMERLGEAIGASVHVKATTGERMGFVGREEGVAALAVATLERSG